MSDSDSPRTRRELIDRIETQWQAWVAAVDGIPEDRLGEPMVGHWSGKDLLGHVAFWEDWVIGDCQRRLAGEPDSGGDLDPVNQGQVEEHKEASVAEQKQYRDAAHARLVAFLETLPDDTPHIPELVTALEGETYGHYDEHAAELRAWRAAAGV